VTTPKPATLPVFFIAICEKLTDDLGELSMHRFRESRERTALPAAEVALSVGFVVEQILSAAETIERTSSAGDDDGDRMEASMASLRGAFGRDGSERSRVTFCAPRRCRTLEDDEAEMNPFQANQYRQISFNKSASKIADFVQSRFLHSWEAIAAMLRMR
jgi:hypothetical protein